MSDSPLHKKDKPIKVSADNFMLAEPEPQILSPSLFTSNKIISDFVEEPEEDSIQEMLPKVVGKKKGSEKSYMKPLDLPRNNVDPRAETNLSPGHSTQGENAPLSGFMSPLSDAKGGRSLKQQASP